MSTGTKTSKRHPYLDEIQAGLRGCHSRSIVQVFGTWYELRTLDPIDEDWALRYTQGTDIYAMAQSRKAPIVAAALVSIGPEESSRKSMDELFDLPDDIAPAQKKSMLENKVLFRDWQRGEVMRWLCEPAGHMELIEKLYQAYEELSDRRVKALGELGPLSQGTTTGP